MSHAPVRPGKPDPKDFLALDALLSDEERLIRDTVRGFVSDRILPDIAEWFEAGVFPRGLPREMGKLGFLGMHLRGTAAPEPVRSRTAWPARNSNTATREPVRSSASRDRWRCFRSGPSGPKTRSRSGSRRWQPAKPSAALAHRGRRRKRSECDAHPRRRRNGKDWILSGSKMWITNGGIADVAIVWAQTEDGIRGFIVPTDTAGFKANDIHHKLSLRASVTSELVFDNVRLPGEAMLPGVVGMRGPYRVSARLASASCSASSVRPGLVTKRRSTTPAPASCSPSRSPRSSSSSASWST